VARPYQTQAIEFLTQTPRALLALDTRLGKTLCAVHAWEAIGARRVLVIAPAIGRLSWADELAKLTNLKPWIVKPGLSPDRVPLDSQVIFLVLAYDALSFKDKGWALALRNAPPWDVMVLDECQYLKSVGSNRTQGIYGTVLPNVHRVWLLSGTPTPNHAGEIYPHVAALWPRLLGAGAGRHAFEDKYCIVDDTPYGRRIRGSQNQDELRQLLSPFVFRRRKQDVFDDMPKVQHNLVTLEDNTESQTALLNPGESELERLLASPDDPESKSIARALGEAKAPAAARWLDEQLGNDIIDKIVVFAWHRTVLDTLAAALVEYQPARIDGSTSTKDRADAMRRFQHDPNCRVFIGQIIAAGTAITLDAASDVAFVESSWVPMHNYQAASRVENVGQRKAVTVSWLCQPTGLDPRIMRVLRQKTEEISAIWD
jgi:SNF2 family DNA or RNA helicase